ncbi:MAG: acyloxyacyl hydrolase [Flavobacterium sp.]|nr:acyloxyacyl hydrolase [Candidatus Neoflavobacterium equi]
MKKLCCFLIILCCSKVRSQDSIPLVPNTLEVEASYFYGSILPHNKSILHLITDHPEGAIISVQKKTYGSKPWQSHFNFPDYGLSFQFQNNKNPELGNLYGVYAHMNFYFFKRNIQFRVGQGIAYATHPYDKVENQRNTAYGAHFMPSTYFNLTYKTPVILKNLGAHIGFNFVHHSNANIKSPNTSTNTLGLMVGVNYNLSTKENPEYITHEKVKSKYPFQYQAIFRGGFAESDVPGTGAKPFYVGSLMAQKQLNTKSVLQLGFDMFWMNYLKDFIPYQATVFYENKYNPNADYRRLGLFLGHELLINRLGVDTQIGYYLWDESNKFGVVYQRLGAKYYFTDHLSFGVGLKTHMAQAEAMEWSLGYKF